MLVLKLQFMLWGLFLKIILMQLSLLMQQMLFKLVNHQAALHNISVLCPSFSTILKTCMVHPFDFSLLVEVSLHPLKELLRVIHLPWLCIPLLLPHWLTHFVTITRMYLKLHLRMMLLLLDSWHHFCSGAWKQLLSLGSLYMVTILMLPNITYCQATALWVSESVISGH